VSKPSQSGLSQMILFIFHSCSISQQAIRNYITKLLHIILIILISVACICLVSNFFIDQPAYHISYSRFVETTFQLQWQNSPTEYVKHLTKFSPASTYSSSHWTLKHHHYFEHHLSSKLLGHFNHIISKFYVLHFLFIIVESFAMSTFIIFHSCQDTTNSQTLFMELGIVWWAFNCISIYSFATYATWINLANRTFCSLYPSFYCFMLQRDLFQLIHISLPTVS